MKNILLLLVVCCLCMPVYSQEYRADKYIDLEQYKTEKTAIKSFKEQFPDKKSQESFKLLREYLQEKEDICDAILMELRSYYSNSEDIKWTESRIMSLNQLI